MKLNRCCRAVEAIRYVVQADIHLELSDDPVEVL